MNNSRAAQAAETGGNEKEAVKSYFNNVGFDRWSRIYSDSDDVNSVQLDIRAGHAQTVDKVLGWLGGAPLAGVSVCDAGCGTGSLAIPLAFKGAAVTATDISAAMADEASRRYEAAAAAPGAPARPPPPPTIAAASLDELAGGPWDVVTCIDVLIHYPQAKVDAMLASGTGLSREEIYEMMDNSFVVQRELDKRPELIDANSRVAASDAIQIGLGRHITRSVGDVLRGAGGTAEDRAQLAGMLGGDIVSSLESLKPETIALLGTGEDGLLASAQEELLRERLKEEAAAGNTTAQAILAANTTDEDLGLYLRNMATRSYAAAEGATQQPLSATVGTYGQTAQDTRASVAARNAAMAALSDFAYSGSTSFSQRVFDILSGADQEGGTRAAGG
jgi:magnesium protoporphyrin O-methyltransferase